MKTGWPAGLMQDDCRALSKWLASRADARTVVRRNLSEWPTTRVYPRTSAEAFKGADYASSVHRYPSGLFARLWAFLARIGA